MAEASVHWGARDDEEAKDAGRGISKKSLGMVRQPTLPPPSILGSRISILTEPESPRSPELGPLCLV